MECAGLIDTIKCRFLKTCNGCCRIQNAGLGGLRHNTVMIGWPYGWRHDHNERSYKVFLGQWEVTALFLACIFFLAVFMTCDKEIFKMHLRVYNIYRSWNLFAVTKFHWFVILHGFVGNKFSCLNNIHTIAIHKFHWD